MAALLLGLNSCSSRQSSTPEERLKWNLSTLVDAYQGMGIKSPQWDDAVKEALTDFAKIRSGSDYELEIRLSIIGDAAHDAIKAGCHDPLVGYFYCRYGLGNSRKTLAEQQEECRKTADALEDSGYPPLRKFYANVKAAEILWRSGTNRWPEVRNFRMRAIADLEQALHDQGVPTQEVYDACHALFELLQHNSRELTNAYQTIEGPLFKNRRHSAAAHLVKADFYYLHAWQARGHATADQVSEEKWKLFFERLKKAEIALKKAWSLDPKAAQIPTLMISLVEGQQGKRPEMERWFQRAMKADPNNYAACRAKLHYLYPQWYGSREDMLAFGRECVASPHWGGRVPLILVDAHAECARSLRGSELRGAYWSQPEVWPDIRAAYEKYSRVNPQATRFRYPYAAYAARCAQWGVFNEQIELLRKSEVELKYSYFGGEENFSNLVAWAAQNAAATNQPPGTLVR